MCGLWKKIKFEDSKKQYILEVTIVIAFFVFYQSDFTAKLT